MPPNLLDRVQVVIGRISVDVTEPLHPLMDAIGREVSEPLKNKDFYKTPVEPLKGALKDAGKKTLLSEPRFGGLRKPQFGSGSGRFRGGRRHGVA